MTDLEDLLKRAHARLNQRAKDRGEGPAPARRLTHAERLRNLKAERERVAEAAQSIESRPGFPGWCSCAPRVGRLIIDTWPAICGDCDKKLDPRKEQP